jgi:hypothetical protein
MRTLLDDANVDVLEQLRRQHSLLLEQADRLRVSTPVSPEANFILAALRETGDLAAAALGDEKRRELRIMGAPMSMDEAVSYALAHINPAILTGPLPD